MEASTWSGNEVLCLECNSTMVLEWRTVDGSGAEHGQRSAVEWKKARPVPGTRAMPSLLPALFARDGQCQ